MMMLADELDRVMAGNPVASSGRRTEHGEWDWLAHVDRRTMRRLTGAGYFARSGLSIDEAADMIVARVPGVDTLDQAIEWYVSTCLADLDARQADRAGVVAWEDQERPDDAYDLDELVLEPVSSGADDVLVPCEPVVLDAAECETVDDEVPCERYPVGARPTFYGSVRPVRRVSCWDSASDDVSVPRRRGEHRTWWWRVRSWLAR